MAKMYIALYDYAAETPKGYNVGGEILDIGSSADTSAALGTVGKLYTARIAVDTACQYDIGSGVTADANSLLFLSAGQIVFDWFKGGDVVSVIEQQ